MRLLTVPVAGLLIQTSRPIFLKGSKWYWTSSMKAYWCAFTHTLIYSISSVLMSRPLTIPSQVSRLTSFWIHRYWLVAGLGWVGLGCKVLSQLFPICSCWYHSGCVAIFSRITKWFLMLLGRGGLLFFKSSVKFQGHTAHAIVYFDPNCAGFFFYYNSSLNSPMAMKWYTKLDVV